MVEEVAAGAPASWGEIDVAITKEIIRQAEVKLQQQTLTAESFEQRATSLIGVSSGAATALLVFCATQWMQGSANLEIAAGCIGASAAWFWSAHQASHVLQPRDWQSAGMWPRQWYQLLSGEVPKEVDLLGAIAEQIDTFIAITHNRNEKVATELKTAVRWASSAPIIGVMIWLVAVTSIAVATAVRRAGG